jgi:hypothetical protein
MESRESSARRPRRRRLGLLGGVVLALAVTPALVLASHQFTDVPNSSPYHAQIDALVGSGITAGCSATTYCPSSAVTRAQMAAFLGRGLAYTTVSTASVTASQAGMDFITTVTVPPRAQPGGTAYVEVNASVNVTDFVGECPCALNVFVVDLSLTKVGFGGPASAIALVPPPVNGGTATEVTVNWVFEVPTGVASEFGLAGILQPLTEPEPLGSGTDGVPAEEAQLVGTIVAQYSPFGHVPELMPTELSDPRSRDALERVESFLDN